jgi:hypothetical protein
MVHAPVPIVCVEAGAVKVYVVDVSPRYDPELVGVVVESGVPLQMEASPTSPLRIGLD